MWFFQFRNIVSVQYYILLLCHDSQHLGLSNTSHPITDSNSPGFWHIYYHYLGFGKDEKTQITFLN